MDIAALTDLFEKTRAVTRQRGSVDHSNDNDNDNDNDNNKIQQPVHQIRVLILQPADTLDDLIECSLEECELSAQADYTALSYSWATEDGDASATRVIQLDDELHPVTENLYLALVRLRSGTSSARRLWVDAICIDQNDDEDKSRQVALMGQIYGHAQHVVAWLGEGESEREDEAAFAALQCIIADKVHAPAWSPNRQQLRLAHTWLPPPRTQMIPEKCTLCVGWDAAHPTCSERYGGTSSVLPELRRAFMTLLRRRYFGRRWIIQEINVPAVEAVTFMWRGYALSRTDFTSGQDVPSHQIPSNVFYLRNILFPPPGSSLIELVARVYTTSCSEPRDRVYALLGLAENPKIKADYSRSVADVYTQFAKLFVRESRIFDLLKVCSGVRGIPESPIPGLPSWVPDVRDQFSLSPSIENIVPAACSKDGTLHVTVYRLGISGVPTHDETDWHVPVLDDVTTSGLLVGNVKIYRLGSGRQQPEKGDILCTLEIPKPYLAGEEVRAWATGFMLRRTKQELWKIVNPFGMGYVRHDYRPYEMKSFSIV